jgi:short-subunit dehydrogenase
MSRLTGKVAVVTGASKGIGTSHSPAGDRARVIANIRVLRFGTTCGQSKEAVAQFSGHLQREVHSGFRLHFEF